MSENTETGFNFDALRELAAKDEKIAAKMLDIVKGTEVGKNYSTTIALNYYDENIPSRDREIYEKLESKLIESGLEKPEERIKATDWVALIGKQNKELRDKLAELEQSGKSKAQTDTERAELEAKFKAEREELINNAQKQLSEKEQRIKELQEANVKTSRLTEISSKLSGFEFNKALGQETLDEIKQMKIQKLIANAKEEDGKTVWCKPDGTPYKTGILNATLDEVLEMEFSPILHKSTAGGGANTEGQKATFTGTQVFVPENSFSTQEQFLNEFTKVCQSKGIAKGEQFDKLYWEAFERYNIASLREF